MSNYKTEELYPWLYRISEPFGVCFYLIAGREKSLLFDTGHGIGNIKETVSSITDKPLTVVLGHGHVDHANGAYQFEEAFMHEGDNKLIKEHCSPEFRDNILKGLAEKRLEFEFDPVIWRNSGAGNIKKLNYDTVFDLGGIRAKIINMAGHTGGSIGLLISEENVLLVSDSANEHCWMFLNESLSVKEYIAMLERVSKLDFDAFYTAHSDLKHTKSDFEKYIRAASNASIEKAQPYNMFPELKPYIYTEDGVSIVVSERTLK